MIYLYIRIYIYIYPSPSLFQHSSSPLFRVVPMGKPGRRGGSVSSAATSVLGAGAGVTVKSAVHPKRMGKILGKNRETSMFFLGKYGNKKGISGKMLL